MTWLEKFHAEHPKLAESYIMEEFCPEDGLVGMCPEIDGEVDCKKCWMRPVLPEATPDFPAPAPCPEDSNAPRAPENAGGLTTEGPDRT